MEGSVFNVIKIEFSCDVKEKDGKVANKRRIRTFLEVLLSPSKQATRYIN